MCHYKRSLTEQDTENARQQLPKQARYSMGGTDTMTTIDTTRAANALFPHMERLRGVLPEDTVRRVCQFVDPTHFERQASVHCHAMAPRIWKGIRHNMVAQLRLLHVAWTHRVARWLSAGQIIVVDHLGEPVQVYNTSHQECLDARFVRFVLVRLKQERRTLAACTRDHMIDLSAD
jgi:hypothetical protein